jgi:hypothetical protein
VPTECSVPAERGGGPCRRLGRSGSAAPSRRRGGWCGGRAWGRWCRRRRAEEEAWRAELGYEPQDYLTLDDVSGYELRPDAADLHTEVVEMKRTEAGLVMPTFNKAIVRLSKEVTYLDDLLAGEGS